MSLRAAKRTLSVAFDQATAADHVAVSSKAGTRIAITGLRLRSAGVNTVTFQKRASDNSTLTAVSGSFATAAAEWVRADGEAESPVFAPLGVDEDFVITLGSAVELSGWLTYTQESI